MSCAVFTFLSWYVAKTNRPNDWTVKAMAIVAIVCLLVAAYGAWSDEREKAISVECKLLTYKPDFEFELGASIWRYDDSYDLTLFFPIASILNRGHASITTGWSAIYAIGEARETMKAFYLRSPYHLVIGGEELIVTNEELLNVRTAETAIERGRVANGRLLWTLPGNRSRQIESLQFSIKVTCQDYHSNIYSAVYTPSSEPLSALVTHAHEKARKLGPPPQLAADNPPTS
jgi:hypothetical protein